MFAITASAATSELVTPPQPHLLPLPISPALPIDADESSANTSVTSSSSSLPQPPIPTPVRWVSLSTLPSYSEDDENSEIPITPPKLFSAKSTPVYSHHTILQRHELTLDDISAHRIRRSMIHSGQQVLSSRMLKKIAHDENNETPTSAQEPEAPDNVPPPEETPIEKLKTPLTLPELIALIVNEKEIIEPDFESKDDDKQLNLKADSTSTLSKELRCCSCYDDLVLSKTPDSSASLAVYICKSPECPGALCDHCLLRQVEITISNALYAVPKIRCPGTCSGRIPTALWRGVLKGMQSSSDDSKDAETEKKSKSELIQGVIAAYDAFSRNFEGSYLDELTLLFDAIRDVLASCNLQLVDVYNQAYELNLIPPVEPTNSTTDSETSSLEPTPENRSLPKITSFSTFASAVFPTAPAPVFHSSSLFRTSRLTDQLDAYIQGDISNLAQSETTELDPTICQTIFCFFLGELAVCLRSRDRVQPFVESYEGRASNSAEVALMKKYSDNAEGLMAMRCASCHRTTGLNYSEKNNREILKTPAVRQAAIDGLLRPLSTKKSLKLLRSWVEFNESNLSPNSFVQVIRECEKKGRRLMRYPILDEVCCPRGHQLVETTSNNSRNLFLHACGALNEAIPCSVNRSNNSDSTMTDFRCTTCSFRYCGPCYYMRLDGLITLRTSLRENDDDDDNDNDVKNETNKSEGDDVKVNNSDNEESKTDLPLSPPQPSIQFNYDGVPTFLAMDNVHSHSRRHYCGRYVRVNGYDRPNEFNCQLCTGTCGPSGGCQCKACAAMNPIDEAEPVPGLLDDAGWRFAETILSLLTDPERRFVLQLELLRQFPKIKTPCCTREHCFMCKIQGHHEGRTCDEVQRESYGIECQFCPGCGVPTVKTEGCSHIICPCGRHWQWSTEGSNSNFTFPGTNPPLGGPGLSFAGFNATTTTTNNNNNNNNGGFSFAGFSATTTTNNSNNNNNNNGGFGFSLANNSNNNNSNTNNSTGFGGFNTTTTTNNNNNNNGGFSFTNNNNSNTNNSTGFGGFSTTTTNNNNNNNGGFGFSLANNNNSTGFGTTSTNNISNNNNNNGGFSFANNNNSNNNSTGFGGISTTTTNNNNNNNGGFGFSLASNNNSTGFGGFNTTTTTNNNNNNNNNGGFSFTNNNSNNNPTGFGGFGTTNNNNNNNNNSNSGGFSFQSLNNNNNSFASNGFGFPPNNNSAAPVFFPNTNNNGGGLGAIGAFGSSLGHNNPFSFPQQVSPYSTALPSHPQMNGYTPGYLLYSTPYGVYQVPGYLPF